ncbi:glycosyltransferase [Lacticaseibacillus zhaodongensis]|uniref:glycosyltransferase n=1 Tax=Lacticaseibacillus zhaodongensis TaxID=2668065 RepID=UPI001E2AC998|nr:glycosyltransferase [Lacticaseibacillus zhaodongensis]
MKIGVLIPALDPDERLQKLVRQLQQRPGWMRPLVIVDDGTSAAKQRIFAALEHEFGSSVHIIHHGTNRGKGNALKTGFAYFESMPQAVAGIATLDADGQHTAADLCRCIERFTEDPSQLVIGVRNFAKNVPLRSRFGNILTEKIVQLLTGNHISDTQTGLRVIPSAYAYQLLQLGDSRFEFELDMLLAAKDHGVRITEVPITTIYLQGNSSSHFRIIRDSIAIYSRFLKFAASGIISYLIDIALFAALLFLFNSNTANAVLLATIIARLVSAVANYLLNRHVVFGRGDVQTFLRYVGLWIVQTLCSGYGTGFITSLLVPNGPLVLVTVIKMLWDLVLFFISYQIQKRFVFRGANE